MVSYFIAFFGGLGLLASLVGFGLALKKIFFSKQDLDSGLLAVLGLGLFIVVGGYLNLLKIISPTSLLALLAVGLIIFIYYFIKNIAVFSLGLNGFVALTKVNKKFIALLAVTILIIAVRYCLAVTFFDFHGTDDYHGYLAFPAKMIQTGYLGNDPFSERRIISSLGGKYFLDATVLSFANFKNLHLIDNGISILLLILLLYGYFKQIKLNKYYSLLIVFLVALIPSPSSNITSFFLAAAVFFAIFRLWYQQEKMHRWQTVLAISLLTFTLVILKTNLIIPAVLVFCCYFGYTFIKLNNKTRLNNLVLSLVVGLIALLPWMIAMYHSSGTPLYPFLGVGYYGTRYGNYAGHFMTFDLFSMIRLAVEVFSNLALFLPLIFLAILTFIDGNRNKLPLLWLIFSCVVGIAAIIYGVGAYALGYYAFPFIFPTLLILLLATLDRDNSFSNKFTVYALIIVAFMLGVYVQKAIVFESQLETNVSFDGGLKFGLINRDLVPASELEQYHNLQAAVPAQSTILARLDRNFLFDFKRNNVYIIDMPGAASLPPGMPYQQGPEKMAEYLVSVGVKYVAYSYGNEANFSKIGNSGMLRVHVNPWLKAETEHSFDFQDNLMELSKSRQKIYDDGKNFVLDISVKINN